MKKKYYIIIFVMIVLFIGIKIFFFKDCYSWAMGNKFYREIDGSRVPDKMCDCKGILIGSFCPPGVNCDGGTVSCLGISSGTKYVFESKKFKTLDEFESYCNNLDKRDYCFNILDDFAKNNKNISKFDDLEESESYCNNLETYSKKEICLKVLYNLKHYKNDDPDSLKIHCNVYDISNSEMCIYNLNRIKEAEMNTIE